MRRNEAGKRARVGMVSPGCWLATENPLGELLQCPHTIAIDTVIPYSRGGI